MLKYLILPVLFVAFGFVLHYSFLKSERLECEKWVQEARDFPLWYATAWQKEQCDTLGVPLQERKRGINV